jgi:hypothetical protein
MKKREAHNECMLCGRQIQPERSIDLLKQLEDLADEAKELRQLIRQYESECKTKKAQREAWLREKAMKDRVLDEQMGDHYTSAFISNVEAISHHIATLDEQIRQEQNWLNIPTKLDERYAAIEKIDGQIRATEKQIRELEGRKKQDLQKFQHFETYLHEFLDGSFRDFESVKIDRESYMPFVNGLEYNRFSTVQINLVVLGYYYALLRYSLNHDSSYPRFLMIDTPNKGDMGENIYDTMMRKFGDLRKEKASFQLIIATREIPEDMGRDNVLTLGDYLLQHRQFPLSW